MCLGEGPHLLSRARTSCMDGADREMMGTVRVFLMFLGLGSPVTNGNGSSPRDFEYKQAQYQFRGQTPGEPTAYVQVEILKGLIVDKEAPELVLVAMTQDSEKWHWSKAGRLRDQLQGIQGLPKPVPIRISDVLTVEEQWKSFEAILEGVPAGCELYIDMTHGFRIIPILFSSAISFLVQAKDVQLKGAFYGAYEPRRSADGPFPIIDVAEFYRINQWAEAVRSLVQDANPAMMGELASSERSLRMDALHDDRLIASLGRLGAVLKNADSTSIAKATEELVSLVETRREGATPAARVLLDLVLDKFRVMVAEKAEQRFTRDWYEVQLKMADILLCHGLNMQGLTVLRELVVSWGEELARQEIADATSEGRIEYSRNHKPRELRDWFKACRSFLAEPFSARLYMDPKQWLPATGRDPTGKVTRLCTDGMLRRAKLTGDWQNEFEFVKKLGDLRNALNHAWTEKKKDVTIETIGEQSSQIGTAVRKKMDMLLAQGVLGNGEAQLHDTVQPQPGARSRRFVNLSNHAIQDWSQEQRNAVRSLGFDDLVELEGGMPIVETNADSDAVRRLADDIVERVVQQGADGAHVSGEYTLTTALVSRLKHRTIRCFAATTKRETGEHQQVDGAIRTERVFRFVRWREYP
jgi:CRISPR-associated Csx2 family protein